MTSSSSAYSARILSCSRPGQAVQPQVEDRLGLRFRQPVDGAVQAERRFEAVRTRTDVARARQHLGHGPAAPVARQPTPPCASGGVRRCLDQRDDLVDVGQRDRQAFEDVAAIAGLAQVEHRPARDHFTAVTDERLDHVLEVEQPRLAVEQRHHVDAEHRLHRRLLVEVVEDDLGVLAALELDDDAHAVLVGLVAQLGDALELLAAHQLGDALDQARLVHLVRQLGDDDGLAAGVVVFLDLGLGADDDAAAAGRVGGVDFAGAVDDAGRREVRARHDAPSARRS